MTNDKSYWRRLTANRVSRRHALAVMGGSAAAAAFMAACGSDDDDGPSASATGSTGGATGSTGATGGSTGATGATGGSTGAAGSTGGSTSSSPVFTPTDTSAQGKAGGAIKHYASGDITHFDALAANSASTVNFGSVFAYNRLLKFASGFYPNVSDGSQEPEMAESWEVSPDQLTVTLKIRQGAGTKWDERAPTNGREMTMDDVLFSFNKFSEINPSGANISNVRNPAAPVTSVEATDATTFVLHLTKPDATIIPMLAATDHLYIMPTESDGGFDPEREVRGNGPWELDEYLPSSRFVWKRNPNYYIANRPFPEFLERPIVSENAQRLAQFRAGNILTDVVANLQTEVIQLKKDVPEANLYLPNTYPNSPTPSIWFGYEGDSPFKDQRVRQAMSMYIDRDAFNAAIYNSDTFEAEGLGVEAKFNTCITSGWGPYWLDPKGPDFGEFGSLLVYNPEEATKLIRAAGYTDGIETEVFFNNEGTYGPAYEQAVEVLTGFFEAGGHSVKRSGFPYSEYLDKYYFGYRSGASSRGAGDPARGYNGFSVQAERPYPTAVNLMLGGWHTGGSSFHGMSPTGENATQGDPKVDSLIEAIQAEFDQDAQIAMTHGLIRYMTEMMYMVPRPVTSPGYEVWWPAISGLGWRERWPNNAIWTETAIDWWIDESKPPFA